MSAYEQRIEPPDRRWQYLLFAAEPYETIAFKVFLKLFWFSTLILIHVITSFRHRFLPEKWTRVKVNFGHIGTRMLDNFSFSSHSNWTVVSHLWPLHLLRQEFHVHPPICLLHQELWAWYLHLLLDRCTISWDKFYVNSSCFSAPIITSRPKHVHVHPLVFFHGK